MSDGLIMFIAVFAFVIVMFLINYIWFGDFWHSLTKYLDDIQQHYDKEHDAEINKNSKK